MKSKKFIPLLIPLIMVLMWVISFSNVFEYNTSVSAEYNNHIKSAEQYLEKDIVIDAIAEYQKALTIKKNDYDTAMKIAELYGKLDDKSSQLSAYKTAMESDRTKIEPCLILADYYMELNNLSEAYGILSDADKYIDSDEIDKRILEIKSKYHISSIKYDKLMPYFYLNNSSTGYAIVEDDGKKGLLSTSGGLTVKCAYDDVGIYSEYVTPVKKDGQWYYINIKGYKKLVPDESMDYLGAFSGGYAAAKKGDIYGYIDKKMKEHHFEFEFAGGFCNGVAAVKKNGKWALINTSFKTVTNYEFDDILLNEYGYCSEYSAIFAKKDGSYFLYDTSGKCLSEGYDEAKLFASKEPAAVKKNGKWGYIDNKGKVAIEPMYENADSFSLGYAPFYRNGKWGCIDKNGNVLIEPQFDSLKPFFKNGNAIVVEKGVTKFLTVTIY